MDKCRHTYKFWAFVLISFFIGGCTVDDTAGDNPADITEVKLSIDGDMAFTRAPGDAALSVNRILIVPFRKTNESLTDDPVNYVPEYNAARQIDVNSFPAVATMLNLSAASTYQIMIVGYNRNDYDFANQNSASRTFSLGSVATPATLANVYLQPVKPTVVPEFFTCIGNGYMKGTLVGTRFKPGQVNNVQATLKRIVSGFTLDVSNIPGFVTSVSLVAEKLVTATRSTDGTPLLWQVVGDGGLKTFGSMAPVASKVHFNYYLLATLDAQKTLFYLDVSYGVFQERYTMKVADIPNVSLGNRITFTPNHWVKVTGDYANINLGFTITDNINLDDNAWDGIQ